MRCELRHLNSPDVQDLRSYVPADASNFGLLVQAMIGPVGGEGYEMFSFIACTPEWLQQDLGGRYRWGRGLLVLTEWNYEHVSGAIVKLCQSANGENWTELAGKLVPFMNWEFEGDDDLKAKTT